MYGDGWILEQIQADWLGYGSTTQFTWRIDAPCQITSPRFEFPITFSGSRKRHHWANPTPNADDIHGLMEEGVWTVALDYDTFTKKLVEEIPHDTDMDGMIWFIDREFFEDLVEEGEMGYSDFVILEWILVHFLNKKKSFFVDIFNIEELLRHYFNSNYVDFELILQMIPNENKFDSIDKLSKLMPNDWLEEI